MSRGVSENRLESIGYGEDKPLDNRNVAEAWEKNRRVDFMVAERAEVQPTAAPEAEENDQGDFRHRFVGVFSCSVTESPALENHL